jgi:hypothetical protein
VLIPIQDKTQKNMRFSCMGNVSREVDTKSWSTARQFVEWVHSEFQLHGGVKVHTAGVSVRGAQDTTFAQIDADADGFSVNPGDSLFRIDGSVSGCNVLIAAL